MGTWNHRVVQTDDTDGTPLFGIYEVHYEGDHPYARTVDPEVYSESVDGLRWQLEQMLKTLDAPILTDKDLGINALAKEISEATGIGIDGDISPSQPPGGA